MDEGNTVNSTTNPNAWIDWFMSRKSTKVIDKRYKAKLFKTFDATVEEDTCKKELLNQGEVAFM